MGEKVSVVVTCYNHAKYIEECLKSIFSQIHSDIDLLVINDGSTDESEEVILRVLDDSPFPNTKYIFQENAGLCVARNRAFDWISGEYLLFVDSDNFLPNDYVSLLLNGLIVHNADIAYGNLLNADTQLVYMQSKKFEIASFFVENYIDSCSLVKTNIVGEVRYDLNLNRKKLEDYDFFMNLIVNKDAKPIYIEKANLNYRVVSSSISQRGNEKLHFEVFLYIMKKYCESMPVETVSGLGANLLILEGRLSDLTLHLEKVQEYIDSLVNEKNSLIQELSSLKLSHENTKAALKKVNIEFNKLTEELSDIKRNEEENTVYRASLENQIFQLRNSTSYRLGNIVIRPIKAIGRIVKHPNLLLRYIKRIASKIRGYFIRNRSIKGFFLYPLRFFQRKQNNYLQPRRILIFVVYEKSGCLQEYKKLFLRSLSKVVVNSLIIVNGKLSRDDLSLLKQFGEVKLRDNKGYDTAAFEYGINYLGADTLSKYDELILANDTNVGPLDSLDKTFGKMAERRLDFWGISYGESQPDFTEVNPYKYIPLHLQSYFLVIEKNMLNNKRFYKYWTDIEDTDSRKKAIGKHETVFTKYFSDLGYKHGALLPEIGDSAMYIHPLTMVLEGSPIIKYTAFENYSDEQFSWQGLERKTEVPELLDYIENKTNYPVSVINQIMEEIKFANSNKTILIIDGVENIIPQCTRYRVLNKAEQLKKVGFNVVHIDRSKFKLENAKNAGLIIIYRCSLTSELEELVKLCKRYNKPVYFDVDDLIIDVKYTNLLRYTQQLTIKEKSNYDASIMSYRRMMNMCDGVITSTGKMKSELLSYKSNVLLNRNLASDELIEISQEAYSKKLSSEIIKIGYFSGSITHNENFEMIKPALIEILSKFGNVELHLVGYLDLPSDLKKFSNQIRQHSFVEWHELPKLISEVDINLAPLVNSIFNEAKSEIKWIEAALVHVPTIASKIGSFNEMIISGETGILSEDNNWVEALTDLIISQEKRKFISSNAYHAVITRCTTNNNEDEFVKFVENIFEK